MAMIATSVNDIEIRNLRTIQRTTPKRSKIKLKVAERRNIIPSMLEKLLFNNRF